MIDSVAPFRDLSQVKEATKAWRQDLFAIKVLDIITSVGILIAGASLFVSTAGIFLAVAITCSWISIVALVISIALMHFAREKIEGLDRETVMDLVADNILDLLDEDSVACEAINEALPYESVVFREDDLLCLCVNFMKEERILEILLKAYENGIAVKIYLEKRHLVGEYLPEVDISKKGEKKQEVEVLNAFYSHLARDFKEGIKDVNQKARGVLERLQLAAQGNPKEKIPFCVDVL